MSIKLVYHQWRRKTALFQCMWRKEAIPQAFGDASIYTNVKEIIKSVAVINRWKDTGKILLNRLSVYLDQAERIPEGQSKFR